MEAFIPRRRLPGRTSQVSLRRNSALRRLVASILELSP
jgi:hypothetical protein